MKLVTPTETLEGPHRTTSVQSERATAATNRGARQIVRAAHGTAGTGHLRPDEIGLAQTPLGDYIRAHAQRRRELAYMREDDPRHLRSAEALDGLALAADHQIHDHRYHASHLARHHMHDGRFDWPAGQAGRAIGNFGFDSPIDGPEAHDAFLADLCDLAAWDACRYIADHEADFDRRDTTAIAQRYGISAERIHSALDGARYHQLFQVGIPHWHDLTDDMRHALNALDGTWIAPAKARREHDEQPTYVNNVGADHDTHARRIVAKLIGIHPDALGASVYPRIFAPSRTGA